MRHHELTVGERVYDVFSGAWGHITAILGTTVHLTMNDEDVKENEYLTESEVTEEMRSWKTSRLDSIYQYAPGLKGRDGHPVCHEHIELEGEYPYFSPSLDENLYTIETYTDGEYESMSEPSGDYGFCQDLMRVMADAEKTAGEPVPVVVEDEEGEIRNITYAWYDKERGMVRISVAETKFEDYQEE